MEKEITFASFCKK